MKTENHTPIFITGAERSGSTFIAKILDLCGTKFGDCNGMYENKSIVALNNKILFSYDDRFPPMGELQIPISWKDTILSVYEEEIKTGVWFVKHSTLARLWPLYHYAFPNAKWIIVRRRTGDIIKSCLKTGYMKEYGTEEGWLSWVHKYEESFIEMMQAGVNCKIIWPERMVTGDYTQIFEMVDWLGVKWNYRIPSVIDPLLIKSREELK